MTAIVISFILVALIFIAILKSEKREFAQIDKTINKINVFNADVKYISIVNKACIAIDSTHNKIAILDAKEHVPSIIPFNEVISVEICKNGASITNTTRGSQVAGAAIGAALLGPAGLLIGALTGKRQTIDKINQLSLKIIMNNLESPMKEIVFYAGKALTPQELKKKKILKALDEWYARLQVIIERGRLIPA